MTNARAARLAWTLVISLLLVLALAYVLYYPTRTDDDTALGLQIGALLLDGRTMYVDVVDLNPPLIFYLNAIPAAAARFLHTHPIPTFLVGIWFLTVASVIATRWILRRAFDESEWAQADLVAASLALFSLTVLLDNSYGQREHLFVLGFFPYLSLRFQRWEGGHIAAWPASVIGALGAIAACIKPHFVVIALAPELYWLAAKRTTRPFRRPEALAFAAVGLTYALHFLIIPTAMRDAYFLRWIPFVARGYHAYDMPMREMVIDQIEQWLPAVACALVFALRPSTTSVAWRLAGPIAVVAATATISYFVQHKGWAYHLIPARAAVAVVLALILGQARLSAFDGEADRQRIGARLVALNGMLVVAVGLAALLVLALTIRPKTNQRLAEWVSGSPVRQTILRHTSPGDPVLFLGTEVGPAYPILTQLDRRPASRYPQAFPIPMIYYGVTGRAGSPFPYHSAAAMPIEETRFRAEMRADIERFRPKVVLIDTRHGCQGCPAGFTMSDYLTRTGFVAEALDDYRDAGPVENLELYLRKD